MAGITPEQIAAFRLGRHHLLEPVPSDRLVDVARDTCGIQSQVVSASRLSFRARTRGLTPGMVDDALWKDRQLVRLWVMRQCVHILPAEDLSMFVAALGTSLNRINRGWLLRYGLDDDLSRLLVDAVVEALEDGPMTRQELGEHVEANLGPEHVKWVTHSWGGVIVEACYEGAVVFGPPRGQNTTFVRRDSVIRDWDPPGEDEARDMLVRRYLHAYGPARVQDFVNWSATRVKEFKPVWERLGDDVVDVEHEGHTVQMLRDDHEMATSLEPDGPIVNLLGNFDTYLLGHKDRTQVVDEARRKAVFRTAGWVSPVVLVNGRALATWSQDLKRSEARITVTPFGRLPAGIRKRIKEEAADLGRFWDLPVKVDYANRTSDDFSAGRKSNPPYGPFTTHGR